MSLLQPRVVGRAHSRRQRQLLAPQPRHTPALPVGGHPDILGRSWERRVCRKSPSGDFPFMDPSMRRPVTGRLTQLWIGSRGRGAA